MRPKIEALDQSTYMASNACAEEATKKESVWGRVDGLVLVKKGNSDAPASFNGLSDVFPKDSKVGFGGKGGAKAMLVRREKAIGLSNGGYYGQEDAFKP